MAALNATSARKLAEQYLLDVEKWCGLTQGELQLRKARPNGDDGRLTFVLVQGNRPVWVYASALDTPGLVWVHRQDMPAWLYDLARAVQVEGPCALEEDRVLFSRPVEATGETTTTGEQKMTATTTDINARVSALIDREGLQSVPQAAEKLGVGRATLYGVLKAQREDKLSDPANEAAVAEVLAALDAAEEQAGATTMAEAPETTTTTTEEANVAPSKTSTKKAAAKAPAKKAAKPATTKQASKTVANTAAKAPRAEKPVQLPKAGEAPFSTGGRMQVQGAKGEDLGLRSIYAPRLGEDGSYTGHTVIANIVYDVVLAAKAGTGGTWKVTGLRQPGAKKAAPAASAKATPAKAPAAAKPAAKQAAAAPAKKTAVQPITKESQTRRSATKGKGKK
jgi:hypothetical protein